MGLFGSKGRASAIGVVSDADEPATGNGKQPDYFCTLPGPWRGKQLPSHGIAVVKYWTLVVGALSLLLAVTSFTFGLGFLTPWNWPEFCFQCIFGVFVCSAELQYKKVTDKIYFLNHQLPKGVFYLYLGIEMTKGAASTACSVGQSAKSAATGEEKTTSDGGEFTVVQTIVGVLMLVAAITNIAIGFSKPTKAAALESPKKSESSGPGTLESMKQDAAKKVVKQKMKPIV